MRKGVFLVILLLTSVKLSYDYLLSEDFQRYGDENKAVWTCYVNNVVANMYVVWSQYETANKLFQRTIKRCPDTSACEEAMFKSAVCLEDSGYNRDAYNQYLLYIQMYPNTKRARLAQRATQNMQASM